jgi:branched-chain amino acid transport system ATP-binding protein
MLVLENVATGYGAFQALFDVSLAVNSSEAVAVIGPNGAGKSTLMRVISGMIRSWSGRLTIDGRALDSVRPHKIVGLGIAHVPESRRLFPRLTVEDNLQLGAYAPAARKRSDEQLDFVYQLFPRLAERRRQMAGTLSGGEQQMCAIGRALMSNPKLLLMDEPSGGLAPVMVERIFDLVHEIRQRGYTVLIVEQQVELVLQVVDRAYLLEAGRIVDSGDASALRKRETVRKAYMGL